MHRFHNMLKDLHLLKQTMTSNIQYNLGGKHIDKGLVITAPIFRFVCGIPICQKKIFSLLTNYRDLEIYSVIISFLIEKR